jgi:arylsulfatase A-like enzyme
MVLPKGTLAIGENVLTLSTGKKGALFHSIELAAESVSTPPTWPLLSAVANSSTALIAWPRLRRYLEIPTNGWLAVTTVSGGDLRRFRVVVTTEENVQTTLFDEEQPAKTVRDHQLSLAAFSGKLVALDLESSGSESSDGEWQRPRVLLPPVAPLPRPAQYKNAILFVADALRADRLPMYAETRVRTPHITKAAAEMGVTFTSTLAASPSSPPSHAAIQSGSMPRQHGILGDKSKPTPNTPMVSALMEAAGVKAAFVGDAGFAMNRLKALSSWTAYHQPNSEGKGADCAAVIQEILSFADDQGKAQKRFFVSAVAFEAHTAYVYHSGETEHYFAGPFDPLIGKKPDGVVLTAIVSGKLPMTGERWAQLKGLYDGEVEHLDGCFGALLEGLAKRGLDKNTAIAFLADHGEGFLEHRSMGHAYGHYSELTHVPLVFFLPGISKVQTIDTVVSHVDVVPTILDFMGLPADRRVQGESLLPLILRRGNWVPQVMPSEYGRSYSLRSQNLHYLVNYGGEESLYDLSVDPSETRDVLRQRPMALGYFRELAGVYLATRARWKNHRHGPLNNPRAAFDDAVEWR